LTRFLRRSTLAGRPTAHHVQAVSRLSIVYTAWHRSVMPSYV